MERYEKYKDSEIEWIVEIPEHWCTKRNRNIFDFHYEAVEKRTDLQLLSLTKKGVIVRDVSEGKGKFPKDYQDYNVVYPNQIIFCLFDIDETPRTVGLCHDYGMITGAYDVFNFKSNINPNYVTYYYIAVDNIKGLNPHYKGLRKTVPYERFIQLYIPYPPLEEQQAIVTFLNDKSAKIDSLISDIERQIELLSETKQTIIAEAVTKGLNKDVKMKDSGNRIIGMIPNHWTSQKMKYAFNERSEKNHPNEQMLSATQSQGVIPQSMYQNRVVVATTGFENMKLVCTDDFVIHLRSFQGGIAYAYYRGIISAAYTILELKNKRLKDYYRYLFTSVPFIDLLKTCVTGIREGQNIDYSVLKHFFIPIPSEKDASKIVAYINEKVSKTDSLIADLKLQIEKLKEYKQRLISDAVTGQIKVC